MKKELTDKMRADMANVQINFLRKNHPCYLTTGSLLLEEYLAEGLKDYSQEIASKNRKVDMELLESLQDGNSTTANKLVRVVKIINDLSGKDNVKDRHLMDLYKNNEDARKYLRNYGAKTSKLLSDYLTKKGFIE